MRVLPTLESPRLTLTAMTGEALGLWLAGDAAGLLALTGVTFDEPVEAPPLFGEDLPGFCDRMEETPDQIGWWVWLVARREDRRAVGVCGLAGLPDADGAAELGYSVYPRWEGQGYATEATRCLVTWVLEQPSARCVRATVPLWNSASVAVARKLGMVETTRDELPEVGSVVVYEVGGDA